MNEKRRASDHHGWRALIRENWYRDVWLLVITALCAFAVYSQSQASDANCARIHAIVKVGGEIIGGGRADLEKYRREGLLSQAQYERAVGQVDERLRRWNTADCPSPEPPPDPTP